MIYIKIVILSLYATSLAFADKDNLAFTDNDDPIHLMGALYIPMALRTCELVDTITEKKHIADQLSKEIFEYWYTHRYKKGERSDLVDSMIVEMYLSSIDTDYEINHILSEALNDPLEITRYKIRGSSLSHKNWKFKTYSDYVKLVKEFNEDIVEMEAKANGK